MPTTASREGLPLVDATQPGASHVFCEGELFDAQAVGELRGSLGGASACQGLAAALNSEGASALEHVDGVFVMADERASYARLYRDPSGLRTLFWVRCPDGRPASAAQPASLARAYSSSPRIDRAALHEYLRLLDIAAPRTFILDVHAVEPGTLMTLYADGDSRLEGVAPPSPSPSPMHFDAAVDRLDDLLRRHVAVRLANVSRPAAFLSGGVDSALLCAIAARHRPGVTALTVGFDGAEFDETPAAARIAAHLGLRHEVLRFDRRDVIGAFERLARGMDQPMADPAMMVTLLAFDHCRQRFDAALDGTGADEALGAIPPRHARLAVGVGSLVPAGLRRRLVQGMRRVPSLAGYTPILDFEHPAETLMRWRGFARTEIEELCGEPVSLAQTRFYRTFDRFPRRAHYERYSALLDTMPCDRLTQAMKLTGMRVRYPFCARSVDTFLRHLPTKWRHMPGQPKRILRELLARYVPRELWDGPKHGFTFPLHDFLSGDDFALVRRHVMEGRWLNRGLLRPDVVRRYVGQYIGGNQQLIFRVWALVVLGAWLDAHEDLNIPPPGA